MSNSITLKEAIQLRDAVERADMQRRSVQADIEMLCSPPWDQDHRPPSAAEEAEYLDACKRLGGKAWGDGPTGPDDQAHAKDFLQAIDHRLGAAIAEWGEAFGRLAPLAVQLGLDPAPYIRGRHVADLIIKGQLKADPSDGSNGFRSARRIWSEFLDGASLPEEALLLLEDGLKRLDPDSPDVALLRELPLETPPRILIDVNGPSATLDGVNYPLTDGQAFALNELVRANGNWIPSKNLNREKSTKVRVDRMIARLPVQIRDMIKSKTGTGFCLSAMGG